MGGLAAQQMSDDAVLQEIARLQCEFNARKARSRADQLTQLRFRGRELSQRNVVEALSEAMESRIAVEGQAGLVVEAIAPWCSTSPFLAKRLRRSTHRLL